MARPELSGRHVRIESRASDTVESVSEVRAWRELGVAQTCANLIFSADDQATVTHLAAAERSA